MAKNNDPYDDWGPEMLKSLLRDSLEHRNAEDFKVATRALEKKYKKGKDPEKGTKIVMNEVRRYLIHNYVKLGTDFAEVLSGFLFGRRVE